MEKIVKVNKFPIATYDIYKQSKEDHKAILKGAKLEIPWGDGTVILEKLIGGHYDSSLSNKTDAKKYKLNISEIPVAYQIQCFDFRIILLYKVLWHLKIRNSRRIICILKI